MKGDMNAGCGALIGSSRPSVTPLDFADAFSARAFEICVLYSLSISSSLSSLRARSSAGCRRCAELQRTVDELRRGEMERDHAHVKERMALERQVHELERKLRDSEERCRREHGSNVLLEDRARRLERELEIEREYNTQISKTLAENASAKSRGGTDGRDESIKAPQPAFMSPFVSSRELSVLGSVRGRDDMLASYVDTGDPLAATTSVIASARSELEALQRLREQLASEVQRGDHSLWLDIETQVLLWLRLFLRFYSVWFRFGAGRRKRTGRCGR
jgi:hypothetical protein